MSSKDPASAWVVILSALAHAAYGHRCTRNLYSTQCPCCEAYSSALCGQGQCDNGTASWRKAHVYHRCAGSRSGLAKSQSALAFALDPAVSGALAYCASRSDTSKTNTDFNTQYGSPDDFKKATRELPDAFHDDEDAVSTDTDELERGELRYAPW